MSSHSPTVRHRLTQNQKRAVSSFIDDPSRLNWDELVNSMKRQVKTEEDVNGVAGDTNAEDVTQLRLEHDETPMLPHVQSEQNLSENNHAVKSNNTDESAVSNTSPTPELVEDFAVEHGIFLRAVLQLLHEKEQPMQQHQHLTRHRQQSFPDTKFDDMQDIIKLTNSQQLVT